MTRGTDKRESRASHAKVRQLVPDDGHVRQAHYRILLKKRQHCLVHGTALNRQALGNGGVQANSLCPFNGRRLW
jgi:hypothetical protein